MPTQKKSLGLRKVAEPADASGDAIDIVLVHGLTGDSERTWHDKDSSCYWPRDLLPIDLKNARIFTYGYDADVVHFWGQASQSRINDFAHTFLSALTNRRLQTDTVNRPLIFVAHSMGGLVVEDLLLASKNSAEEHLKSVLEQTIAIAFLGTPLCGSHLADWGAILGGITNVLKKSNTPIVEVLKPESEVLARIQGDFQSMIRDRAKEGSKAIEITCFYEDLAFTGVGFVVPKQSAILAGRTSIGIHGNHVDMTKFSDAEDPGYQAVLGELWRWSRDASRRSKDALSSGQRDIETERSSPKPTSGQPTFHSIGNTFQGTSNGSGKVFQGSNFQSQGNMTF